MKARLILYIGVFALTLSSCEEDNKVANPETFKPDNEEISDSVTVNKLEQELIGTWKGINNATHYTFAEGNTYSDSLFLSCGDSILVSVIHGTFRVDSPYLEFSNLTQTYDWSSKADCVLAAYTYTYPQLKIQLEDSILTLVQTKEFTPVANNASYEIYGKWTANMLMTVYEEDSLQIYHTGSQTLDLEILEDTNLAHFVYTYAYGNVLMVDTIENVNFTYSPPYIKFNNQGEPSYVFFNADHMLFEHETRQYKRLK